ncbi:MAG: hypothetical protein JSW68_04080 [Burkholderiales bacterium]|nr:MAG: hypothetical protein JSW68_04080 [Burkholderiales bacterium]
MTISVLADLADLLAALGVISSLVFVAFEIRKSSEQARLSNWNSVLSGLREHKRRTDDPRVADLIVRGRADFEGLSEADKLAFGFWMEELIQCFDGLIVHQNSIAVSPDESRRAAVGAFAMHFSFPGCRAWYQWSGIEHRWPKHLIDAIEEGFSQARTT